MQCICVALGIYLNELMFGILVVYLCFSFVPRGYTGSEGGTVDNCCLECCHVSKINIFERECESIENTQCRDSRLEH